ncbi:hypothetical protein E1B28_008653 [Marasmius oreades]|uniref:Uncharacterized protein n=1 Tax=Marasmius oreades TaxID=181124 RepID=A0A9P7RYU4_9AGAR|nr:uncharacterized protein E1B28_008653 [Marasmius oreades]KAG7092291.1 hypothetical protein E1B28_008653 [Marasmius oreades]
MSNRNVTPTPEMTAPSSPALTSTSASSFDVVSSRSCSSTISDLISQGDSEEEIVWTVARHRRSSFGASNSSGTEEESEDDFVVLSRRPLSVAPPTPLAIVSNHSNFPTTDFAHLSLNSDRTPSTLETGSSSSQTHGRDVNPKCTSQARFHRQRTKKQARGVTQLAGFGERPIVDDVSEIATEDIVSDAGSQQSVYEEAVQFVTMFLTNPDEYNTTSGRLALLQSIIIELGLSTVSPSSVKSAKALLKSQAFLNVRDYLAVREHGLEAIQRIMHPSRSALARSIRKSKKRVSMQWIKDHGLDVFLVPCYYH